MGFWIFMLIMELLMPVIMIVFGRVFMKNPPKSINMVYGYRTKLSMRNQDTWDFAHRYFGKIWYISGLVLLPISVISMVLVMDKGEGQIGLVGGALTFAQMLVLIGAIIPTEIALSKKFDSDGNPR